MSLFYRQYSIHIIKYDISMISVQSDFELTKGMLWGVYFEKFGEYWLCQGIKVKLCEHWSGFLWVIWGILVESGN